MSQCTVLSSAFRGGKCVWISPERFEAKSVALRQGYKVGTIINNITDVVCELSQMLQNKCSV